MAAMWSDCKDIKVKVHYQHTYIHTYKYFYFVINDIVFSVRYSSSEQFLVSAGADSQILGTYIFFMYVCEW